MGFVTSAAFLLIGKLTGSEWITFMTLVYGIFAGANVWEKK